MTGWQGQPSLLAAYEHHAVRGEGGLEPEVTPKTVIRTFEAGQLPTAETTGTI